LIAFVEDTRTSVPVTLRSVAPPIFATLAFAVVGGVMPTAGQSPTVSCVPLVAPTAVPPAGPMHLTVFAAASLTDAFEAIAAAWVAAHPGSELILSFDASSALRAQIAEGAPADVFASADERNAQALVDDCLSPGSISPFAHNELVVVVPVGNPAAIETPADLARTGVRVVAALPDVPITRYTTQVVANLAGLDGYPEAFAEAVTANTVSEEENVRAVLTKIELGEGDAALVYATDAHSSSGVEVVPIPDEANELATYAAVTVGASAHPSEAAAFLDLLVGPEAQAILATYGFVPVIQIAQESPPV
jgi:molybdate transport system substrate-binding protein